MRDDAQFVFVALGGLREIGMNCGLYGFGPKAKRKWLMVDLGLTFAGAEAPGVDLIMPDLAFVHSIRKDLLGLIITHAHEDHIGALAELWPSLEVPVYMTRFAAGLAEARRLSEPGAPKIPIQTVNLGQTLRLEPFGVEFIPVAHSIPESAALAIKTPAGLVIHTGDWRIDERCPVGLPTDSARLQALGDEGVLALMCDSTNVVREGQSPSEADVAQTLHDLVAQAQQRVIVTTFASNVARLRAAAEAGLAHGRQIVVIGRAMERVVSVARECGYLEGLPPFLGLDAFDRLPRAQVLGLATGSQGEPRAALARLAEKGHPQVSLSAGDCVIFSSRTIPGNEKAVSQVINGLVEQNVQVITDRTHLVHVSGHPRRGELAQMYRWTRPQIAIPVHGEALHLAEHVAFAKAQGVPQTVRAFDGDLVALDAEQAGIVGKVKTGRRYKDGEVLLPSGAECVAERRRLSVTGVVSIALGLSTKGERVGLPDVMICGLPEVLRASKKTDALIDAAIFETLDGLPRAKRADADFVANAVESAVRNSLKSAWGKKPIVHVLIIEV